MDFERISHIVESARSDGRDALLEPEGLEVLAAMGLDTPPCIVAREPGDVSGDGLWTLGSEHVVVKVVSPMILHKTDVGGVVFIRNDQDLVRETVRRMSEKFSGTDLRGFLIQQRVAYDPSPGGELLIGARWAEDFGPIVALGPGGLYTEFLAEHLETGRNIGLASAEGLDREMAEALIHSIA
ncbi:MAG: acetate--CoA ligase family protein, partial [Gemmatimonadales bacterium]